MMKIFRIALIAVIAILGLSAGTAKVLLLPAELEFFSKAGLGETMLSLLGIIQLLGAILFVFLKTRKAGAYILALTFLLSSMVIFGVGDMVFGLLSLLPIALIISVLKIKQR
jgi:hypothetical protein